MDECKLCFSIACATVHNYTLASEFILDHDEYMQLVVMLCVPFFVAVSYTHLTLPTNREV